HSEKPTAHRRDYRRLLTSIRVFRATPLPWRICPNVPEICRVPPICMCRHRRPPITFPNATTSFAKPLGCTARATITEFPQADDGSHGQMRPQRGVDLADLGARQMSASLLTITARRVLSVRGEVTREQFYDRPGVDAFTVCGPLISAQRRPKRWIADIMYEHLCLEPTSTDEDNQARVQSTR